MSFAKAVFTTAGIVGILQLLPMYFLFDFAGRASPPMVNHAEYYFGFAGVALAWQFVFLLIGSNPYHYKDMMLVCVAEKASWVLALVILWVQERIGLSTVCFAPSDLVFGLLFIAAYTKVKMGEGLASR